MSLTVLAAALALEWSHPDLPAKPREAARHWMDWWLGHTNAGGVHHGHFAWSLGVLAPVLLALLVQALLDALWSPLGWVFSVVVLYFCLGFKRASQHAAGIADCLRRGEVSQAASMFAAWRPGLTPASDVQGLVVQTAETLLRQSLLRLFGTVFWFVLLSAPGALLYLLAHLARDGWQGEARFGAFAARVVFWLDWAPVRLTAFSFAIAGNFQDAMDAWREATPVWPDKHEGILLAAGAGALGLRLGGSLQCADGPCERPVSGSGEPPDVEALSGVAALVWRAILLWGAAVGLFWLGSV